MPERVFITGGSGFIGACLTHDLIAEGHDVHLLLRPEHQGWRLADVEGQFTSHSGDLRDAAAVKFAVDACRPEVVYHLATHGAYPAQIDRGEILATNLQGTVNLVEALKKRDLRAMVHAGSSSEYGHKNRPMREDDVLEPRNDYAVGKAAASLFCLAEAYRGMPISVVRVFSAYGPWEEPSRLVPYVMDCCHRGKNPRVTSGSQPRDFIYVDDVVELLKVAAHSPQSVGNILHAGTGVQHFVREMIETIVAVSGSRQAPEFGSEQTRRDEPECWVADIEQTRQITGWAPRFDMANGVQAMWQWHLSRGCFSSQFLVPVNHRR